MRGRYAALALLAGLALLGAGCSRSAQSSAAKPGTPSPEVSFARKTITIVVGFPAGSASDIRTRRLAPYLEKFLPGNPTVIVQNMPGAAGKVSWSWMAKAAPKDGTAIGYYSAAIFTTALFEPHQLELDVNTLQYLTGDTEPIVLYAHRDLGVRSAEELARTDRRIVNGDTDYTSTRGLMSRSFLNLLGTDYKYVTGYSGSGDARLGFQRGELNVFQETLSGYFGGALQFVEQGTAFPIAQEGTLEGGQIKRDPRVSNIPTFQEELLKIRGKNVENDVDWAVLRVMQSTGTRGWFYPPGVPDPVVTTVREALKKVFADPEVKAQMDKEAGYPVRVLIGQEVADMVQAMRQVVQANPAVLERLKNLTAETP
jgi:tripartite-type tricarboxylate transporter receptor subunit TctC